MWLEGARSYFEGLVEGAEGIGAIALETPELDTFWVAIEELHRDGDYVALAGSTFEGARARVMIKGSQDGIYGWVVLEEEGVAFEYTTVDGMVEVASVPVEKIFPVCLAGARMPSSQRSSSPKSWSGMTASAPWRSQEPHVGDYPGTDLYSLESRPGATKVLFLDISEAMNGDTPIDFSKEEMWKAWQTVASGFSAFELNVTTNAAVYDAAAARNKGVAKFYTTNEVASCPLGAFGNPAYYCSVFTHNSAEPSLGYGVGRTTLHEVGHLFGLGHDGTSGNEYFLGFEQYEWYPIMGNYYAGDFVGDPLYQWSDASYEGAVTYFQDNVEDLDVLTETLPYRPDDIPASRALFVAESGAVSSDVNRGQVGANTDTDSFTFEVGSAGGHATLSVSRIEYIGGAMLDVDIALKDATGTELAHDNAQRQRSASVDLELGPGIYELVVKGGAEGTATNGFTNYSSLGFYGIDGEIQGLVGSESSGSGGVGGAAAGGEGPGAQGATTGTGGARPEESGGADGGGADGVLSVGGATGVGESAGATADGAGRGGAPPQGADSGGTGDAAASGGGEASGGGVTSDGGMSDSATSSGGVGTLGGDAGLGGLGAVGRSGAGGELAAGALAAIGGGFTQRGSSSSAGGGWATGGGWAVGGSSAVGGAAVGGAAVGGDASIGGAILDEASASPGSGGALRTNVAASAPVAGDGPSNESKSGGEGSGCGCQVPPAQGKMPAFATLVILASLARRRRSGRPSGPGKPR